MVRESDLEKICPSCRVEQEDTNGWKPEFAKHFHYKTRDCFKCGHKIFFRTKNFSSGHY